MAWAYMLVLLTKEFPISAIFCVNMVLISNVRHVL